MNGNKVFKLRIILIKFQCKNCLNCWSKSAVLYLWQALFENLLVELPLAEFFLSKLVCGAKSDVGVHQLASLDPVMYRSLLYLKSYEGDVADLGLDFTVLNEELGETRVRIDIIYLTNVYWSGIGHFSSSILFFFMPSYRCTYAECPLSTYNLQCIYFLPCMNRFW